MELKSGELSFYKFLGKDHKGDREEKMVKLKEQKEVNVEWFIVE